eukprot:7218715-Ditylum_brightwellii.AAC.1
MTKTDAKDSIPIITLNKLRPSKFLKWFSQRKRLFEKNGQVLGSVYLGAGHYKLLKGSITSHLFKLYWFKANNSLDDEIADWIKGSTKMLSEKVQNEGQGKMEVDEKGTKESVFKWLYMALTWNLMCCSDSTKHIK